MLMSIVVPVNVVFVTDVVLMQVMVGALTVLDFNLLVADVVVLVTAVPVTVVVPMSVVVVALCRA